MLIYTHPSSFERKKTNDLRDRMIPLKLFVRWFTIVPRKFKHLDKKSDPPSLPPKKR